MAPNKRPPKRLVQRRRVGFAFDPSINKHERYRERFLRRRRRRRRFCRALRPDVRGPKRGLEKKVPRKPRPQHPIGRRFLSAAPSATSRGALRSRHRVVYRRRLRYRCDRGDSNALPAIPGVLLRTLWTPEFQTDRRYSTVTNVFVSRIWLFYLTKLCTPPVRDRGV